MPLQVPLAKGMLTLLKYCGYEKLKFKVNTKLDLILEKAALSVERKNMFLLDLRFDVIKSVISLQFFFATCGIFTKLNQVISLFMLQL